MNSRFWQTVFLFLLLVTAEIVVGRRGGGGGFGRGGGGSRGSSAARASSARSGGGAGGWFGGGGSKPSSSGSHFPSSGSHYPASSGGHYSGKSIGGTGGGWFGSGGAGKHAPGGYMQSSFRNQGTGSRSRSDMFRNMIVGAAAGYLTYQAGKAIIRSMAAPMTWNNRQYYWGQQYYPGGHSGSHTMCRMPIGEGDSMFGNVYTSDGSTRPKEIVWSCSYNEECCGYECCPGRSGFGGSGYGYGSGGGGGGARYWNSGSGIGIGTLILLLLCCCCSFLILKKIYDKKRENDLMNGGGGSGGNPHANKSEYQRGNVAYSAQPPEAPPPYPAATGGAGYPPEIGFRYPPA